MTNTDLIIKTWADGAKVIADQAINPIVIKALTTVQPTANRISDGYSL